MKPLLALSVVLVISAFAFSCSSTPKTEASAPAPVAATPAADGAYAGGSGLPTPFPTMNPGGIDAPAATPAPSPSPQAEAAISTGEETPDDVVPDFKEMTFNSYTLPNIRPRIVEISVETHRTFSERAHNKVEIEQAVRGGIETALKKCGIHVVSRSQNKMNFDIKDCRNMPDSAECVAIDAVFRSPKFELEVGGYSHNGYTTKDGAKSRVAGDLTRAYYGAINAVLERLNKQLEIVGANQ